jgi:hypothetical protein
MYDSGVIIDTGIRHVQLLVKAVPIIHHLGLSQGHHQWQTLSKPPHILI